MKSVTDIDGIDGPFERACREAEREDRRRAAALSAILMQPTVTVGGVVCTLIRRGGWACYASPSVAVRCRPSERPSERWRVSLYDGGQPWWAVGPTAEAAYQAAVRLRRAS